MPFDTRWTPRFCEQPRWYEEDKLFRGRKNTKKLAAAMAEPLSPFSSFEAAVKAISSPHRKFSVPPSPGSDAFSLMPTIVKRRPTACQSRMFGELRDVDGDYSTKTDATTSLPWELLMGLPLVPNASDLKWYRVPEHPAARALKLITHHVGRWTRAIVETESIATSGLELVCQVRQVQAKLRSEHQENEIPDADNLATLTSQRKALLSELQVQFLDDGNVKEEPMRLISDVARGVKAMVDVLGCPSDDRTSNTATGSHTVFEALFEKFWCRTALELLQNSDARGGAQDGALSSSKHEASAEPRSLKRNDNPGDDANASGNAAASSPDVCSDLCASCDTVSDDVRNIARLLDAERKLASKRVGDAVCKLDATTVALRDLFTLDINGFRNPELGTCLEPSLNAFFQSLQEMRTCDKEFRQPITSRLSGVRLQERLSQSFRSWLCETSRLLESIVPRLQRLACEAKELFEAHKAYDTFRQTFLDTAEASARLKTLQQPKQSFIDDLRAQIAALGDGDDGSARASFEGTLRHALRQQHQFAECVKVVNGGLAYLRTHEASFPEFDVRPLFALDSTALRRLGVPLDDLLVVRSLSEYQDVTELPLHTRCMMATHDGAPCFLKQFHLDHPFLPSILKREVRVLRNVRSRYILSPVCAFYQQSDCKLYLHYPRLDVSWKEYAEQVNAKWNFRDFGPEKQNLLDLIIMLAMGLEDLHQFNLVHGDISLNNAMLTVRDNGSQVVDRGCWIDFSESVDVTASQTCNVNATLKYLPPEGLGDAANFKPTKGSDIFAFGSCIVESCKSFAPEGSAVLDYARQRMCNADPAQRPSAREVVMELEQHRKQVFANMDVMVTKLRGESAELDVPFYWHDKNSNGSSSSATPDFGAAASTVPAPMACVGIRTRYVESFVRAIHRTSANNVARVERIENVPMWRAYRATCGKLKAQLRAANCYRPDVSLVQHSLDLSLRQSLTDPLCDACGEVYLFHGTAVNKMPGIVRDGFDPAYASKGCLGQGCYFSPLSKRRCITQTGSLVEW